MPGFRYGLVALASLLITSAPLSAWANTSPAPDSAAFVAEDPTLSQMIGKSVPGLSWQTLDGQTLDLVKLAHKGPVYLKLWATYCIPCRAQMPEFERLYQRYKSRMSIVAVDIGFGEKHDKIVSFVRKASLTMPVVVDDGRLSDWLHIRATPLHVLIDRDGRLAYLGHQDGAVLEAALERVVAKPRTQAHLQFADVTPAPPLAVGAEVPTLALSDATQAAVPFRPEGAIRPQVVLFTAPWCESYLSTMDPPTARNCARTREIAQKLVTNSKLDWTVIGAKLWTEPADMASFRTLFGPGFRILLDENNQAFTRFGIRQIPAVALINKDGRLVEMLDGSRPDLGVQIEAFARKMP